MTPIKLVQEDGLKVRTFRFFTLEDKEVLTAYAYRSGKFFVDWHTPDEVDEEEEQRTFSKGEDQKRFIHKDLMELARVKARQLAEVEALFT